jgi:hypothetical protein
MLKYKTASVIVLLCLFAGLFSSCFSHLTQKNVIYENNFEGHNLDGLQIFTVTPPPPIQDKLIKFNGSTVFGTFNNTRAELTLNNLPGHDYIRIELDLYIHDFWRGNYLPPGSTIPDIWNLMADGSYVLSTTFSNTSNLQDYPNFYQAGAALPPRSYAADTSLPGYCAGQNLPNATSSYRIVKTVAHTSSSLKLSFNDALQGSSCEKSWSIDNLKITALKN